MAGIIRERTTACKMSRKREKAHDAASHIVRREIRNQTLPEVIH
jgi:hypothetical protein